MTKEETAKSGNKPPKVYKIQIDKVTFEVSQRLITGRELLTLAGKTPPEQFAVYLKVPGAQPQRIGLDVQVDLEEPGKEKFVTLPLDQTEGLGMPRRQFALPAEDMEWLENCGHEFELVAESGVLRVVIHKLPLPDGYNVGSVDVNLRIDPGYPDSQIDMAYFFPDLQRKDGKAIGAVSPDTFDGKTWQRWSRHRTGANPWRPGLDNLATHMALVEDWLKRELTKGG